MPTEAAPKRRQRGFIRRRGNSYQVLVYAGTDPLTGKDSYLTESTKDAREAERIRTRLLAQVDQQRQGTIDSHLHALRHYSATELITAGVDIRTVAGRLGHGGGGTTTLRVYTAWVAESDRRAVEILADRLMRSAP
ncbi:Phage integrase family protein [Actinopolymorpha cephalotaxi]|uniref:Phage integrase family protein n=1 Tax=Actinopolymorpha cephalotaxi TaxID=504797 RepID=A0A1I2LZR5_9ACTN|nr:tyrosine-type recombinase/integrase [Actinopolymorpha cephalotaxi]NYH81517.1 site-specific recombinase XerD [Actinopolymorpha cephalotaxi]SFF84684.1 Phage integrase family protein [Actinopolymorpha cephalotaxi]